jgi:ATPase subunit of ABC transporter with duplicated ATPase domains
LTSWSKLRRIALREGADTDPGAERLGGTVIEAKNLSKAYGDKLLFEDLSFSLPPGGIVGVIGPTAPARPPCSSSSPGRAAR